MKIRQAHAEDAEVLRLIAQKAFSHYVACMGKQPAPMLANFDYHLRFDRCMIAEMNSLPVGYAILQFSDAEPLMDTLAVLPEYQRQGVGRRLMQESERVIREKGFSSYQLYSNIHMTETINWYLKCGFQKQKQITEDGFERVYLRKPLI